MPVWRPKAPLCCWRPSNICAAQGTWRSLHPSLCWRPHPPTQRALRRPLLPQPPSMPVGCTDCGFWNASHSLTGASPINGSPRNCSSVECHHHRSQSSCVTAVQGFRDSTPTQTSTSAAHWHVPHGNSQLALFLGAISPSTAMAKPMHLACNRAQGPPLCGTFIPKPSLSPAPAPYPSPACAQTAPANDSPVPSADAFRCRLSPRTRRSQHELGSYSDIQFGIPLHI